MDVVNRKMSVSKVFPAGKPCSTEFQVLSRSRDSSVVLCRPRSGRTHQIRVHLQYLGGCCLSDEQIPFKRMLSHIEGRYIVECYNGKKLLGFSIPFNYSGN